jgi:hypothetical protein
MANNVELTLKPIKVKPDSPSAVDYDELYAGLSADQKLIGNKIIDEAERQGVDPDLMLSLAHIENKFKTGPSPVGALGPMQLMPGTAKELGVDPLDIDQNIAGGVTYFKMMLDKYKDPYIAGIAYNAGPGVADKFLETDDSSVLPPETKNYIEQLDRLYKPKGADVDTDDVPVIDAAPEESTSAFERDAMAEAAGAGVGAAAGMSSGAYGEAKIKQLPQSAQAALEKAEALARQQGVLEEVVKTTPGGVTQQGGIGSGAMRHSNTMGEITEANTVRKGTTAAGPGYSQRSRLIVPDKYVNSNIHTKEQLAALKELEAAQKYSALASKYPGVFTDAIRNLSKKFGASALPGAATGLDVVEAGERFKQGDYPGAAISGVGALGGALSMIPPIGPVGAGLKLIGGLTSMAAPALNYYRDSREEDAEPAKFGVGGSVAAILAKKAAAKKAADVAAKKSATVMRPKRVAYPGIYDDPKKLVAEATSRVEEESPLLKRLFGVTRDDLFNITEQGRRKGNITERPFKAAPNATGAAHAEEVMNPRNVQRIQDIIGESKSSPELYKGMASWYTMDPLFNRYVELYGLENAIKEYNRFNTLTGMASPGSEVLTELNRGSAANWLDAENRFSDFVKYGGKTGTGPADMRNVLGHPYHSTAHGLPMSKYLESGVLDMGSAKVPSYITASGVPETGFQTSWPVGDAHWSRLVGLPDVRGARTKKGVEVLPNASASVPEMVSLGPWWEQKIAKPMELESVPAQAVVWGSGSGATGVTSPIGSPKLELISKLIGDTANRLGVSPETARDLVILRKTHLAEGGIVKGYAKGGSEGTDIDELAEYYGSRLDSSNSDMRPPVISDKGNVVHNMVAERNKLADKYLGGVGRFASRGLEGLRTALDSNPAFDKSVLYPEAANLKVGSDLLIGQLPETLYDYTTSGQPGFVGGNEWVRNPATGGMMHTDPYGDIRAFDFFNLLGIEAPIAAGAKTAYKVAKPLVRAAAESTVSGINRANRALRTPDPLLMNIETSTANRSDDAAETTRRFNAARSEAKYGRSDLGGAMKHNYPIGQGVWTGEEGAAQFHPNVMANVDDFSPEEIDHMRQLLDQYGIGAGRFRPDLISQPSRANAIQILDADPEWIKNIGQHYAQSDLPAVVFAQPNNRAMLFNMNSDLPKDLSVLLDAPQLAGKKVRYGKATIPTDRNYIDSVESARVTGTKKPSKKKAK